MVPEPQTTAFEDERHARLRALSRLDLEKYADGVPGRGQISLSCQLCCQSRRGVAEVSTPAAHCRVSTDSTAKPQETRSMQTDAHNMGREERRALLEQRRAAVARQLRRLAIELTDIDRQLDEIEQSER